MKNKKCLECNLCDIKYALQLKGNSIKTSDGLDYLLKSPAHVSLLLSLLLPNNKIASEVTTEGNSRNKRIDTVIIGNENIYLIKILNDIDKDNYYFRSYSEIVKKLSIQHPNNTFKIIFIIASSSLSQISTTTDRSYTSLRKLVERILTNGHTN